MGDALGVAFGGKGQGLPCACGLVEKRVLLGGRIVVALDVRSGEAVGLEGRLSIECSDGDEEVASLL